MYTQVLTKGNSLEELQHRLVAVGFPVKLKGPIEHQVHGRFDEAVTLSGLGKEVYAIFVDWPRLWTELEVSHRLS